MAMALGLFQKSVMLGFGATGGIIGLITVCTVGAGFITGLVDDEAFLTTPSVFMALLTISGL